MGHLAGRGRVRHAHGVAEEMGIYREAVLTMMGSLPDIYVGVDRILGYIEGDEGEEEEDLPYS